MHIITVCAVSMPRHKSHDERPRARLEVLARLACFCATSVEISELFSILSYRICKEPVCQPGLLRNCIQAPRKWLSRMLLVFSTRHLLSELTPEASLPSSLLFATFCTPSSPSWLELRLSFRITRYFLPLSSFLQTNQSLRRGDHHHAKHNPNCFLTTRVTSAKPTFQQDLENQDFSPMFT